jgi:spermidine synthase
MAPEGEEVLMARSVWRRHAPQPSQEMARKLEAVLGQLQPRQGPIPTPVGRWSR